MGGTEIKNALNYINDLLIKNTNTESFNKTRVFILTDGAVWK